MFSQRFLDERANSPKPFQNTIITERKRRKGALTSLLKEFRVFKHVIQTRYHNALWNSLLFLLQAHSLLFQGFSQIPCQEKSLFSGEVCFAFCRKEAKEDQVLHTHKRTNTQTHKHTNTQTHKHTHTHTHTPARALDFTIAAHSRIVTWQTSDAKRGRRNLCAKLSAIFVTCCELSRRLFSRPLSGVPCDLRFLHSSIRSKIPTWAFLHFETSKG